MENASTDCGAMTVAPIMPIAIYEHSLFRKMSKLGQSRQERGHICLEKIISTKKQRPMVPISVMTRASI